MHLPLEIDFGQVPASAAIKDAVRSGAARLNRYCPDIIGCYVTLPRPGGCDAQGHPQVHVRLTLPGADVEVHHP